jgi:hypothetical protein
MARATEAETRSRRMDERSSAGEDDAAPAERRRAEEMRCRQSASLQQLDHLPSIPRVGAAVAMPPPQSLPPSSPSLPLVPPRSAHIRVGSFAASPARHSLPPHLLLSSGTSHLVGIARSYYRMSDGLRSPSFASCAAAMRRNPSAPVVRIIVDGVAVSPRVALHSSSHIRHTTLVGCSFPPVSLSLHLRGSSLPPRV